MLYSYSQKDISLMLFSRCRRGGENLIVYILHCGETRR